MKTAELIKQAEELLGKCNEGPWNVVKDGEGGWIICSSGSCKEEDDKIFSDYKSDLDFSQFARNHMQEFIDKLKKCEEALTYCAYNPATNKGWGSHDQLIDGVKKVQEIARKALEEE